MRAFQLIVPLALVASPALAQTKPAPATAAPETITIPRELTDPAIAAVDGQGTVRGMADGEVVRTFSAARSLARNSARRSRTTSASGCCGASSRTRSTRLGSSAAPTTVETP